MYNKIVSLPMLAIGLCLIIFMPSINVSETTIFGVQITGIFIASFGFLWAFASIINTMAESDIQMQRFKEVILIQKKLEIKKTYKEKIEKEFKEILTQTFPNFEKDLVSKFSFANDAAKEAFLAICPQLESGSSFEKYVDKISDAMIEIRKTEIAIDEKIKEIACYNESPWHWFKRPMPVNIKDLCKDFE